MTFWVRMATRTVGHDMYYNEALYIYTKVSEPSPTPPRPVAPLPQRVCLARVYACTRASARVSECACVRACV